MLYHILGGEARAVSPGIEGMSGTSVQMAAEQDLEVYDVNMNSTRDRLSMEYSFPGLPELHIYTR